MDHRARGNLCHGQSHQSETLLPARDKAPARFEATALPDVLQFMRLLWAIVHALQMQSKEMSKAVGVTGPQRLVLRVVGLFPGVSPGTLAEILHPIPAPSPVCSSGS